MLDWELAHVGDPMRDLGWLVTRSWRFGVADKPVGGFGETDDLIAGYEAVSGKRVDREAVRFWEVFGSFWWSVGTLSMGQSLPHRRRAERRAAGDRPALLRMPDRLCQPAHPGPGATAAGRAPDRSRRPNCRASDELLRGRARFPSRRGRRARSIGRNQFLARVGGQCDRHRAARARVRAQTQPHGRHNRCSALLLGAAGEAAGPAREAVPALSGSARSISMTQDLHAYLRDSVLAQVLIDQPSYAGAVEAATNG